MSNESPVKDHLSYKTTTFAVMLLQIKVVHCISSEIAGGELVGGDGGGGCALQQGDCLAQSKQEYDLFTIV